MGIGCTPCSGTNIESVEAQRSNPALPGEARQREPTSGCRELVQIFEEQTELPLGLVPRKGPGAGPVKSFPVFWGAIGHLYPFLKNILKTNVCLFYNEGKRWWEEPGIDIGVVVG